MSSYGSVTVATKQSRGKLHKRGNSGSSAPASGPPSALRGSTDAFTTPFATYEEPTSEITTTQSLTSTPKLKPYLRKTSSSKEDQGKLDLSRSTVENEGLAGLGIQDFNTKSAGDVNFAHSRRRTTSHTRTISGCSSVSNGSGTFKPTHPFIHPMRQTPRSHTPPVAQSSASSLNEDEADESSDVVDDEFKLGNSYRSRRSMSISSTPQIAPTPLSQSHTALDLGIVPKLTSNVSQSNISVQSTRTGSSPDKQTTSRSRGESNILQEQPISPSARTSIDKAFSFVSRKSELEHQSRDERIREARRKFEEKEADKARKAEKEAYKRRESDRSKTDRQEERQARRSEASDRIGISSGSGSASRRTSIVGAALQKKQHKRLEKRDSITEKFDARAYENYAESNEASLPVRGRKAGASEKTPATVQEYRPKPAKGSWVKFETWVRTRVSSCGGESRR
jgi:hypothetical protein